MNRNRKQRALTLVEVMISIFILGIAFMSFGPALVFSRVTVEKSKSMEMATQTAHAELESWRTVPFDELPAIPGGKTTVAAPLSNPVTFPGGTATLKFMRIDEKLRPTFNDSERVRAEVTVAWNGGARNQGSVTMHTILCDDSEEEGK